jgi:hypothetical protein
VYFLHLRSLTTPTLLSEPRPKQPFAIRQLTEVEKESVVNMITPIIFFYWSESNYFFAAKFWILAKSLILAQDERWRRG